MADDNDFEPVEEEKEPESLKKKWEAEEFEESVRGKQFLIIILFREIQTQS